MRPLCFMLNFLIRLSAYPNVRTEPQSDIGRTRGKKEMARILQQMTVPNQLEGAQLVDLQTDVWPIALPRAAKLPGVRDLQLLLRLPKLGCSRRGGRSWRE